MANTERGLKRIVGVISSLGLIVCVTGLVAAGYFSWKKTQAIEPLEELLADVETDLSQEEKESGDAQKLRVYLTFSYLRENLEVDPSLPSDSAGQTLETTVRYAKHELEGRYPSNGALIVAGLGLASYTAVWILFAVIRWIILGFKDSE